MLNAEIEQLFVNILKGNTYSDCKILSVNSVPGGSINNALKINCTNGNYFAKWNYESKYPGMFQAEVQGLQLLKDAGEIAVPDIVGYSDDGKYSMLVLKHIEPASVKKNFWTEFGESLARLHKHEEKQFGLDHDNYIGSLKQYNTCRNNWVDFFIEQRLEIQLKMARDRGLIDYTLMNKFSALYNCLPDFFPPEKPSLLHGDLWNGNYMTSSDGNACIIDPAVYYGHRIMDLGMSLLFGGFAGEFYDAYNAGYPLEKNWKQSVEIANLYPLLVHVNLFGGGYTGSVKSILSRF